LPSNQQRQPNIEQQILDWFRDKRGITAETLAEFGVHQSGDRIIFPYPAGGEKSRLDPSSLEPGQNRGFRFTAGRDLSLYHVPNVPGTKQMFLVEGETDTMRLHQEVGGAVSVIGLSGIEAWRPAYAKTFADAERVWVVLDNDEDYNVKARVDACWKQIRADLGAKARRVSLPVGIKDTCDFFDTFDVAILRELCKRTANPERRFTELDLTAEPPPIDWLVDNLICEGDVNLFMGDPGIGKSWLTMSLAVAVADGRESWLGRAVKKHGEVLYIDEENPEDIIYNRFRKLSLTKAGAKRIHYLYRPGIWMNKEPDAFLDEALELNPSLIVIDSLSRIHSEDENSANSMARLFREAIQPLARETGAAVIVVHHAIKSDTATSFQRSRGSGDITAVVDAALDIRGTDIPGKFYMTQYKSRRRLGGEIITVQIADRDENRTELLASTPDDWKF
jgi:hypothetical protein